MTNEEVMWPFDSAQWTFGIQPDTEAVLVRMLAEGANWSEIGAAVGWDPDTLRTFWEDMHDDEDMR